MPRIITTIEADSLEDYRSAVLALANAVSAGGAWTAPAASEAPKATTARAARKPAETPKEPAAPAEPEMSEEERALLEEAEGAGDGEVTITEDDVKKAMHAAIQAGGTKAALNALRTSTGKSKVGDLEPSEYAKAHVALTAIKK